MSTIAQTIAARHLEGRRDAGGHAVRGSAGDRAKEVALMFAAPVIGLGYAMAYGFVGLGAVVCYGLKAFGIQCGLLKS